MADPYFFHFGRGGAREEPPEPVAPKKTYFTGSGANDITIEHSRKSLSCF